MKTLKSKLGLLLLAPALFLSYIAAAQPCKTDELIINTGYDHTTQSVYSIGQQDPNWEIVSFSGDMNTTNTNLSSIPSVPLDAYIIDPLGSATNSSSQWLSFYDPPGSSWQNWYMTLVNGDYHFKIRREFTVLCEPTEVDLTLEVARDNYILNMQIVDASNNIVHSIHSDPVLTVNQPSFFNSFLLLSTTTPSLNPGTYYLEVEVHNLHLNITPLTANPHGINIAGTISAANGNLLAPGFEECDDCGCSNECYWKVEGNSILNGNNIFGTLTNDDVRIKTSNTDRGIMEAGGFMGWNTMNATARWHVNCAGGNAEQGLSDIRFENLESGTGTLLAIDRNGYVFNTGVTPGGGVDGDFWSTSGNFITENNYLGTNSEHDVIMRTAGVDKGIWTSGTSGDPGDDGRLGWHTLSPTAHLHVNCDGGNESEDGSVSDIRFENLEESEGYIMVINEEGYVFNSRVWLTPDGGIEPQGLMKQSNEQQERINKLEDEVNALKEQIRLLLEAQGGGATMSPESETSMLYQNVPNPFGKETVISYYVKSMQQNAYVIVYDMNGRELSRHAITETGKGQVTINSESMVQGSYMYALVIDGMKVDTKKMVLTK